MQVIRVRHDLPAHAKALLASLGWDYIVDPGAPECEHWTNDYGEPRRVRCRKCLGVAVRLRDGGSV